MPEQIEKDDRSDALERIADAEFEIKTNGKPIRQFLRLIEPIADEFKLFVGERETAEFGNGEEIDGLHVTVVDPANVAMLSVTMPAECEGFRRWDLDDGPYVLGINRNNTQRHLKFARMRGGGVEENGDPVTLRYGDSPRRMETAILRPDQKTQRVTGWNLISPEAIRAEPDTPDLDGKLNNRGHVESPRALKDAIDNLTTGDVDNARVRADPDVEGAWQFYTEGEKDWMRSDFIRFKDGYEALDDDAEEHIHESSTFTSAYLKLIAKGLKRAKVDRVAVRWGDEWPCVFRFFEEDYGIRGRYTLAPRIESA